MKTTPKFLLSFTLMIVALFSFNSCEKAPDPAKTFADIYNLLPAEPTVKSSNITVVTITPGNGPNYETVYYKTEKIKDVYRGMVAVLSLNFALTVEPFNNLHFIYNKRISGTDYFAPYQNLFGPALREMRVRIDTANNSVYFRFELTTQADIERAWNNLPFNGQVLYFRYSILSDELIDEAGKIIPLSRN